MALIRRPENLENLGLEGLQPRFSRFPGSEPRFSRFSVRLSVCLSGGGRVAKTKNLEILGPDLLPF